MKLSSHACAALLAFLSATTSALPQSDSSITKVTPLPNHQLTCFTAEGAPTLAARFLSLTNTTDPNDSQSWEESCSEIVHNIKGGRDLYIPRTYSRNPSLSQYKVPVLLQEPLLPHAAACAARIDLQPGVASDQLTNKDLAVILQSIQWNCVAPGKETVGGILKGVGVEGKIDVIFGKPPLPDF